MARWFGGLSILIAVPVSSFGEQRQAAQDIALESLAVGLGDSSIALPASVARDSRGVRDSLLSGLGFSTGDESVSVDDGEGIRTQGDGWVLYVSQHGRSGWFENSRAQQLALSGSITSAAPTSDQMEKAARSVLQQVLSRPLGINAHDLIALRVNAIVLTASGSERVLRRRVTFGRIWNNLPVLSGSRVVVDLADDCSVIGFSFDWPAFEAAGSPQLPLSREGILRRVHQAISMTRGRAMNVSNYSMIGTSYPVALEPDVQIERLACGLHEPALRKGASGQVLRLACAVVAKAGSSRSLAMIVPVATETVPEDTWPESRMNYE